MGSLDRTNLSNRSRAWRATLLALAICSSSALHAQTATVTALNDQFCAGDRSGGGAGTLNCTANDFTASVDFTQPALGALANCSVGDVVFIDVIATFSSASPIRYDAGIFIGQNGQDPATNFTTGANNDTPRCSLGVFPTTPSPFFTADADVCGDFLNNSNATMLINDVKVVCQPVSGTDNRLNIPFLVAFENNASGNTCTASNLTAGTSSKCVKSSAGGVTGVTVQAFLDITKQTEPDGDGQVFAFTSSSTTGVPLWTLSGSATTQTLSDGQTKRIQVPLPVGGPGSTNTLTLTETLQSLWDSGVEITCAAASGSGNPVTFNKQTRTITAAFTSANFGASCTITNTKRSRITLNKTVGGRVNATDQFTVRATTTGDFQDTSNGALTSPRDATTSGSGTTATTGTFTTRQRVSSSASISTASAATVTLQDIAAGTTNLSDYDTRLTCTNAYTGTGATPNASLPANVSTVSQVITPAPGDDITCTYTNTPRPRISLQKAIAATGGGRVAATDQFALTAGTSNGTTTGTGSTVTSAAVLFIGTSGNAVTLSEAASGTTNLGNYSTSISCTNANGSSSTVLPSGTGTSFNLTPVNNDVISCTLTNTRRSASLTLRKSWVNAILNNAVNVTLTGLNSDSLASVANTATEIDADASPTTVFAGESVTIAESFTVGLASNYSTTLSCSGNNGALTYTAGATSGSLAISGADSSITCTYANARGSADLRLTKTNTPGVNGEVDQVADTVISGAASNYTVTLTNLGPDSANGVVITDPAPSNLTCSTASCSASGGAVCPVQTGAALVSALQGAGATVPTLPNGGAVTITLSCTVQ